VNAPSFTKEVAPLGEHFDVHRLPAVDAMVGAIEAGVLLVLHHPVADLARGKGVLDAAHC